MQLKETDGALKLIEREKEERVVINGVAYRRLPSGWSKQGENSKLMPVTQRWIDRSRAKTIVRFPRLKREFLYDGSNLTWKNAPRFDPEKIDAAEWLIDLFIADKSINFTLMLYASECIATGLDCLGIKTLQRRFSIWIRKTRACDQEAQSSTLKNPSRVSRFLREKNFHLLLKTSA